MATSKKRILVVEDERPLAKALELKFSAAGFEVTVASDGQHATEILADHDFDLVVLDLIMPRMDGFGLLKWMKEKKKAIPSVVLSNLGQSDDIAEVKKLGAIDYYVKADTPLAAIVEKVQAHLK